MGLPMTKDQLLAAMTTNTAIKKDDAVKSASEIATNSEVNAKDDVVKSASEAAQNFEVNAKDDVVKSASEAAQNFEVNAKDDVVKSVSEATIPAVNDFPRKRNGLDKFSLTGLSSAMAKEMSESAYVLDGIALSGQSSIIFAAPNTGKTLITLRSVMQTIKAKTINPYSIYYLNADDSYSGLVQKLKIAEEFGFQMLAEGHKGFRASDFLNIIEMMIERKQCNGVVIIVDTLKKFADLMDKKRMREFNRTVRVFVSMGGTFIALAHVNKKPDANGKPVYAGTTDTVDDFDCAYTLHKVRDEDEFNYVQFENIKRRGNVAKLVNYRYSNAADISYEELLLSVEYVDSDDELPFYEVEQQKSELLVIDAVKALINKGINTKMILAETAAKEIGLSKRKMLALIEQYIETHWNVTIGERNANFFHVID
jgi:hypothetical protein